MQTEPTLIQILDSRPGPPPGITMHPADLLIWWGTMTSAALGMINHLLPRGLLAQVAPAIDPQRVSWSLVALSAIGVASVYVRLRYGYLNARLEVQRTKGENEALKAQVAAYQQREVLRDGR